MGKKKQTAGEKMAGDACGKCSKCRMCAFGRNELARRIDAAIRRAVKDAWWTATNTGTYSKEEIEAMYGVKL